MEPSELSFFTSQELVDELMRRKTFLGVIVHSQEEMRRPEWSEEQIFKVRFNNNLDAVQASRLLDRVSEYIDLFHS